MGGRKMPPAPPGSTFEQANEATRRCREAIKDIKDQVRASQAAMEVTADRVSHDLGKVVAEARELKRGFQGVVEAGMAGLVDEMRPVWRDEITRLMRSDFTQVREEMEAYATKFLAALSRAESSLQAKEKRADDLLNLLQDLLAQMVASDLIPTMAIQPPLTVRRGDKTQPEGAGS